MVIRHLSSGSWRAAIRALLTESALLLGIIPKQTHGLYAAVPFGLSTTFSHSTAFLLSFGQLIQLLGVRNGSEGLSRLPPSISEGLVAGLVVDVIYEMTQTEKWAPQARRFR
uniref:AlNc14C86G5517 protein n=1 Tax=Albugo laibachii Nc14 TaxID=890382 RepID=F0WFY4_9STRA|nr:AlNc14C86G5517 [Albugo laibachii Nc14]|eukprot:CCA20118.1 AlNc14C86G5517 [Albugo laibachii Nc14]